MARPEDANFLSYEGILAIPAGIIATDGAGCIILANPRAVEILGSSAETMLGGQLAEYLATLDELQQLCGTDDRGVLAVSRGDGVEVTVGYRVTTVQESEGSRKHWILFRDMTKLTQLKEERDRLLQLATVNQVLPTLLHELRNPLASVITGLEVVLEESMSDDVRELLVGVHAEVRRALLGLQGVGTVGRSLHVSRLQAVGQALRDVCNVMLPVAGRRGIWFESSISDLPDMRIDRNTLSGLVYNLINNAIAACGMGDRISVVVTLSEERWLDVVVTDSGCGMDPETIGKSTDLFFTTKTRGSGIGLALCRRLAEASGGGVEVESELGVGTVVSLRIRQPTDEDSNQDKECG